MFLIESHETPAGLFKLASIGCANSPVRVKCFRLYLTARNKALSVIGETFDLKIERA